jgi:hypothetical protein
MNRDDFAWVFVRAFGVYFAYHVLLYVFSFAAQSIKLVSIYTMSETASSSMYSLLGMVWFGLGTTSIQIAGNALIAYYCIFKGELIHRVLAHGIDSFRKNG